MQLELHELGLPDRILVGEDVCILDEDGWVIAHLYRRGRDLVLSTGSCGTVRLDLLWKNQKQSIGEAIQAIFPVNRT